MRASVALAVAIVLMFGAAMAAEYAGVVERDVPTARAAEDEAAHGAHPAQATTLTEKQLRLGLIGGFVCISVLVLIRRQSAP